MAASKASSRVTSACRCRPPSPPRVAAGADLTDETGVWVWQYWIEQEERIFFILLTCGP
jgi:hypothetical protein